MEAYSSFAEVYDIFQDNVPYEEWCSYVTGLLREQGVERGLVLDLGCGSGILAIAALRLGATLTVGATVLCPILDALRAAPADELTVCINTGSAPCVIVPADGSDGFVYMVLPVRLAK